MSEKRVRSIPGISPPAALLTRGRTRFFLAAFLGSVTTIRNPSSIRDVSVRPSAAALRLARLSRSSGRRTVVRSLICQDIWVYHQYVNTPAVSAPRTDQVADQGDERRLAVHAGLVEGTLEMMSHRAHSEVSAPSFTGAFLPRRRRPRPGSRTQPRPATTRAAASWSDSDPDRCRTDRGPPQAALLHCAKMRAAGCSRHFIAWDRPGAKLPACPNRWHCRRAGPDYMF